MKSCPSTSKAALDKEQINQLKDGLPSEEDLYSKAAVLKAISDPTRLKILHLLKNGELCACEIIDVLEKPQPTVSHHLNILKNAGLLKWRKEGIWMHYKLSDPEIIDRISQILTK